MFAQFAVQVPLADSENLRGISAMALASLERRPDMHPFSFLQRRRRVVRI